jgi:Mor family transcriptional regulator
MKLLQDILDRKNYLHLVSEFGGSRVWVPKIGNLGHRNRKYFVGRDAKIRRMRKNGASIRKLTALFNLSEKRVYNIINNAVRNLKNGVRIQRNNRRKKSKR